MFNKIVVAYIQKKWLKLIHNNLEIVRPTYSKCYGYCVQNYKPNKQKRKCCNKAKNLFMLKMF